MLACPRADSLVCMTQCSRDVALDLLRKIGAGERVDEARATLPDPIDLDRDENLLAEFGLSPGQLVERLGGSP